MAEAVDIFTSERKDLEYKSAKGGFPNSFWETFSAFANTNGGTIVLGVKEKNRKFYPDGLSFEQIQDYKKKFWDDAHNKTCISAPLLVENDIIETQLDDGSYILTFSIPRAPYNLRPVHLTLNPMGHTYLRYHNGDYLCTDAQVRQMFSDANHLMNSADARILKNYTIDDIDLPTLHQYRRTFDLRHENHPWSGLPDDVFLKNIGAYRIERTTSEEGFTVAGILMFGKTASIIDQDCTPWFFPDYRERLSLDPIERWSDRLFPDGTWEANLYQFFRRVLPKVFHILPTPFRLADDGVTRIDFTTAHTALREAIANALIHASYTQIGNITIDRYSDSIVISNPGTMLVSIEEYNDGHSSVCRNPILQKMFVLIGIGEKAGSGADTIRKGWNDNGWELPTIIEKYNPDSVTLVLSLKTSDKQAIKQATKQKTSDKQAIKQATKQKTSDKQTIKQATKQKTSDKLSAILDFIRRNQPVTTEIIAKEIGLSIPRTRHYLGLLVSDGRIMPHGANRNRTYTITDLS